MKIINNEQVQKGHLVEPINKSKSPADNEFSKILKESVESTQKESTKPQSMKAIQPGSGIQLFTPSPVNQQFTIERIENLINLLDQYRQKLSDPQITLKTVAPLVKEMEQAKESLRPILDSLKDGEEIKAILNQTLVTTSLEIAKYYRGDYNLA